MADRGLKAPDNIGWRRCTGVEASQVLVATTPTRLLVFAPQFCRSAGATCLGHTRPSFRCSLAPPFGNLPELVVADHMALQHITFIFEVSFGQCQVEWRSSVRSPKVLATD